MGLNGILPGTGTVGVRLAKHIIRLIADERIERLEDFHQRVFESDVSEAEVNERVAAMKDGDFQHLLAAMLSDLEREKLVIYSAAYIKLVDDRQVAKEDKRMWVFAVSHLHLHDFWALQQIADRDWWRAPGDSEQRLANVGAVTIEVDLNAEGPLLEGLSDGVVRRAQITDFGNAMVGSLERAIREALNRG